MTRVSDPTSATKLLAAVVLMLHQCVWATTAAPLAATANNPMGAFAKVEVVATGVSKNPTAAQAAFATETARAVSTKEKVDSAATQVAPAAFTKERVDPTATQVPPDTFATETEVNSNERVASTAPQVAPAPFATETTRAINPKETGEPINVVVLQLDRIEQLRSEVEVLVAKNERLKKDIQAKDVENAEKCQVPSQGTSPTTSPTASPPQEKGSTGIYVFASLGGVGGIYCMVIVGLYCFTNIPNETANTSWTMWATRRTLVCMAATIALFCSVALVNETHREIAAIGIALAVFNFFPCLIEEAQFKAERDFQKQFWKLTTLAPTNPIPPYASTPTTPIPPYPSKRTMMKTTNITASRILTEENPV